MFTAARTSGGSSSRSSSSPQSFSPFPSPIRPKSPILCTFLKPTQTPPPPRPLVHTSSSTQRRTKAATFTTKAALPGLDAFQSVLEASSVVAAIIVVHESGHFLAATLQGIHVSKFAVGFGPVLFKFTSHNVEYSLRAFPLGGFVGFPDDDPDSDIPADDADLLKNRPVLDRIIVISAGVIANVVFAYLIVLAQVVSVGLPVREPLPGVLVPEVRPESPAARYGLRPGDVILGVDGLVGSPSVSDLVDVIKERAGQIIQIRVQRGKGEANNKLVLNVVADKISDGTGRIGVQLSPNYNLSKARPSGIRETLEFTTREFLGLAFTVLDGLKQTFFNFSQSAGKVAGPVAIIAVGAEVARSSSDGLFQFAAILNINLAVINLLPLPALDGGTLALILVEAVRGGRKIPREVEQRIMSSGIMVVFLLGVFLIVRDTLNLDFIKELL